jgi:hypothetical protein
VGTRLAGHQGEHKLTNLVTAGKLPAQDNAGMEASYENLGADDCSKQRRSISRANLRALSRRRCAVQQINPSSRLAARKNRVVNV